MPPIIEVRNLSKQYLLGQLGFGEDSFRELVMRALRKPWDALGGRSPDGKVRPQLRSLWALKDISFELQHGDALGIVGRNGAGKSTLLKILSRITDPTEGWVKLRGRTGSLLEVGTGFHPELTGRENIYLNGAILGLRRAEINAVFDEIVDFSEIGEFLDTPVKRYSSGMYVRLAFAVAAHLDPEILVVDEVLAVGDAAFQKKCLGKMSEAATHGRTVLFVSHNMAAVSQLCTRAIWLDHGRLQLAGSPDEVIRAYLSAGSQHVCDQHWPDPASAPGDDRVRLLRARLLQNGLCTPVIDINQPCRIEIKFQTLGETRNLITTIHLYNQHNVCLFSSSDWRPNSLSAGCYSKYVELPAHVLAEGPTRILVLLSFFDPEVRSVLLPDALTFDAVDSDHPQAVRGAYKGPWPGVVRLALTWSDAMSLSQEQVAGAELHES